MKRGGFFYRTLLTLVGIQVLYGIYWALHDISARLGLWPDPDQAEAFVTSLMAVQETFFFSHVVMNAVVFVLVWKRRWWALPAFVLSFLLDRSDWVMMTGNVVFSGMVDVDSWALFSFALQGAIIALLVILVFEGRLR
ncbi:MAG: hypothetical protein U9P68_15760 [Pseudomonadota bacterium]|nr:hypothetical protein [Pseudomonadota bacterium]